MKREWFDISLCQDNCRVNICLDISRYAGKHIRTSTYTFKNQDDAQRCLNWWKKRGGITDYLIYRREILDRCQESRCED